MGSLRVLSNPYYGLLNNLNDACGSKWPEDKWKRVTAVTMKFNASMGNEDMRER
jgi:hypothetical protein